GKWPDQTLDQAFGLSEVLAAVSTLCLSCKTAGRTLAVGSHIEQAPAPRRRPWSARRRLRRPRAQRAGCDGLECGGHTFTLPCQLCERARTAQFPIAIRTTRLQTNIGERTMRSRHPAFRVSTNSGRHEILSPLVCGRWSAFPFESFLQR